MLSVTGASSLELTFGGWVCTLDKHWFVWTLYFTTFQLHLWMLGGLTAAFILQGVGWSEVNYKVSAGLKDLIINHTDQQIQPEVSLTLYIPLFWTPLSQLIYLKYLQCNLNFFLLGHWKRSLNLQRINYQTLLFHEGKRAEKHHVYTYHAYEFMTSLHLRGEIELIWVFVKLYE